MDTFMDKLAQKLNAQEMIKANSAADAEEMDQLKNQLREYDECLAQMQQANKELRAVNHAMETLMSETIAPEVTKLSEESVAAIRKMQQVRTAALAPAEPSSQDHAVAAKASRLESEARAELQSQQAKGAVVGGTAQNEASDSNSETDSKISEPKVEQKSATMARRGDVIANRYQMAWQPQGNSLVSRYA